MDTRQENKLIRRVQRYSDRAATDEVVLFYYREIYDFSYKQTGNIDLAMDLTQEIFIVVRQSIVYLCSSEHVSRMLKHPFHKTQPSPLI